MQLLTLEKQGESIGFHPADPARPDILRGELRLAPGAKGPVPHAHPLQSESFVVVSGVLEVTIEGKAQRLEAGDRAVVEPGQMHTFANGSPDEPLVAECLVEPPLHFAWFLSEMAKSAIRNGGGWDDLPLLEVASVLHRMGDEYVLASPPRVVQRVAIGVLARVASTLGKDRLIAPMYEGAPPPVS